MISANTQISTITDITLVTLQNCPSAIPFTAEVFGSISKLGINVDMISISPAHGAANSISFTILDDDLGKLLPYTSGLQEKYKVKTIVSGGNCKVSVYDEKMKTTAGIAASVFSAAASVNSDIRIITTSDVEIALLVPASDFDATLQAMQEIPEVG